MSVHLPEDMRPPRLSWLCGIALGSLCAVLIWPPTQRQVIRELALAVPTDRSIAAASPAGFTDPAVANAVAPLVRQAAANSPDNLQVQMAAAMRVPATEEEMAKKQLPVQSADPSSATVIRRLGALRSQFPNSAELLAATLRYYAIGKVKVSRPEAALFLPKPGNTRQSAASTVEPAAQDIAQFNDDCAAGEAIDPGNALFPMLHAVGLFEMHEDAQAIDEYERAAVCSHWHEYLTTELDGESQLQESAFGKPGELNRATFGAAILLPILLLSGSPRLSRSMRQCRRNWPATSSRACVSATRSGGLAR
jgi:hypothetical protein